MRVTCIENREEGLVSRWLNYNMILNNIELLITSLAGGEVKGTTLLRETPLRHVTPVFYYYLKKNTCL